MLCPCSGFFYNRDVWNVVCDVSMFFSSGLVKVERREMGLYKVVGFGMGMMLATSVV